MQASLCRWEGTEANQSYLSALFKFRLVGILLSGLRYQMGRGGKKKKTHTKSLREMESLLMEEDWKLSSI